MSRWLLHLPLIGLTLFAMRAQAQVPPEKALATFTVAEGLELSLWAHEPLFSNPTSIDVDHKGRVWVCEAVNYRRKLRGQPPLRKEGDRILLLEDSKGVGRADRVTVFYQSPELMAPLGVAVSKDPVGPGYRVYVCQSPDILVFEDRDGDGKADGPPKKLLTGFQGIDHDHGVHGINIGPDQKLYFTVGDAGMRNLQSADGKGRQWSSNGTDCRAGTVWRCDLDGKNLELIAHNFRNNYEACVDSFGTVFLSDNDDDGNQQTRICHVMPGGNYGYHPRGPGQSHWHEEQPGIVHKVMRTGFGSPTGICFYEGTLLPAKYRGQLLHTDAGPRELRCFHLKNVGAGYEVEKENLVTSTDNWFRPSDVCVAPDGSLMIADWYDPGVGGHGMGDWTRGRIYRLTPKGHKGYKIPPVDLSEAEGIRAALASPALSVRAMAQAKLATLSGKEAVAILKPALEQKENAVLRARALWIVCLRKDLAEMARETALGVLQADADARLRCQALRMLLEGPAHTASVDLPESVQKQLLADSAEVRREALLSLRHADPTRARPLFFALARLYGGQDRFYLAALNIACGNAPDRRSVLLADFGKEFPEWNEKVADLVWELRPASVLPTLGKKLADAKLSAASRARIIDILAASEDAAAGKAMLDVLQGEAPEEVRAKVLENLKLYLPTRWSHLRPSKELTSTIERLLARAETRTTGLNLLGAANRSDLLPRVVSFAGDPKEALSVRQAAVQTLGRFPQPDAVAALESLLSQENATLRDEAVQALGTLASAKNKGSGPVQALKALQNVVTTSQQPLAVRQGAVSALAGTQQGTVWLLDLHDRKQLPADLKADTARLLRNSPFQGLRNRAMIAFPPPGKIDPKKLPNLVALARRKGQRDRGKQLLTASAKNDMQCMKCHMVRGMGGHIGPDLSMIGKKASRENLLESILYPSKAIADQYLNWQIETRKGVTLTGLVVEETPDSLLLRDGNGKDTRIEKKEIEARVKSPNSLMPSDLLVYMTEDDLIDIVEYLLTLKTPVLTPDVWHIVGPFENGMADEGLDRVFPPETRVDLKSNYKGKHGSVRWRTVRPDATGYIDLRAFHGAQSANIVSYLYQEIDSPADQAATLLIGNDDGCKIWVNGKQVHVDRRHLAATPEMSRVEVKLKKGANTILVKINNGDGPHGLFFSVVAEQELKLAKLR